MSKSLSQKQSYRRLVCANCEETEEGAAKLEAYEGYGYVRFNVNSNVGGIAPSQSFNANGGGGQFVCNANSSRHAGYPSPLA
jgi:hypothetical protein